MQAKPIVTKLICELEKTDDTFFVYIGEALILNFADSVMGYIPIIVMLISEIGITKSIRNHTTDPATSGTDYTKSLFEKLVIEFKRNPSKRYVLKIYNFILKSIENSIASCDKADKNKGSSFLDRIAQESYNEGYQAALEDLGIAEEGLFPSKEMRTARTESKKFFKEAGNYANQAQNALKSGDTKAYKAYYTKAITSLKKAKACLIDGDKYAKKYEELIESWSWLRENPTN